MIIALLTLAILLNGFRAIVLSADMKLKSTGSPSQYILPDQMITYPLSDWCQGVKEDIDAPDWTVRKIEHMKNFHFSAITREYLRVTIEQNNAASQHPSTYLFIERQGGNNEVTVGWRKIPHPKLTPWWILRLWRGYFTESAGVIPSTTPLPSAAGGEGNWRAIGYSGSDFLCSLTFNDRQNGISLSHFANIIADFVREVEVPQYSVVGANGFWFAYMVYKLFETGPWPSEEFTGQYFHHRGKFAGLSFLPYYLSTPTVVSTLTLIAPFPKPLLNQSNKVQEREGTRKDGYKPLSGMEI